MAKGTLSTRASRFGQQRLAGAGGADEQHVRLIEFDGRIFVLDLRQRL
jgi:hypothetical protein